MKGRQPIRRCAVYTRKSSEEGLEQAFNSLHAQREACEAFIRSQQGEGWQVVATPYDDGGLSGGTMERPALKQLLADVALGKVDIVVVYKVDRLTRSLMDFAKIVELFDAQGVSFVAVTQQFNTTSSMGRLTLNILLSFAQFEREVTGERIRDKIAASKRKGMWMGGTTPLGYQVQNRQLVVDAQEAETVRLIFQRYRELGSVRLLKEDLDQRGIVSKVRVRQNGSGGGQPIARGALYALLSNPIYIGEIRHKGTRYPGRHDPLIERDAWQQVQDMLAGNAATRGAPMAKVETSPLTGKLFDEEGRRLTPSHAVKAGRRYRYYITQDLVTGVASDVARGWRLPAAQLEALISREAAAMLGEADAIAAAVERAGMQPEVLPGIIAAANEMRDRLQREEHRGEALEQVVERVELRPEGIALTLTLAALTNGTPISMTRDLPMRMRRRGVEMRLVVEGQAPSAKVDPTLLKELMRAHRTFEALCAGTSITTIAAREKVDERYISLVLPLAFLAPDIVQAIVDGTHPPHLNATTILRRMDLPLDWNAQRTLLGLR